MKIKNSPVFLLIVLISSVLYSSCQTSIQAKEVSLKDTILPKKEVKATSITFDTALYNAKMVALSNGDTKGLWPVKLPYPLPGAIFPYNRIVAYYGNLYSKRMGILGELPKDQMLKKLQGEVDKWKTADSSLPVIPALHYIAVTAQASPGRDSKYRLRMPFHQIDTIIKWAEEIKALVFLDIQVALSNVKSEMSLLEPYLKLPQVNLGIDPEFSMKSGEKPGTKIGTFNGDDINEAINFLADIVRKNNLTPKILIIHRFTQGMVTDYKKIKKVPEVQVVMDMDGWGGKILKSTSYQKFIYNEPVQFAGIKLFYKNDLRNNSQGLFQPAEVLKFKPRPVYIQYQ